MRRVKYFQKFSIQEQGLYLFKSFHSGARIIVCYNYKVPNAENVIYLFLKVTIQEPGLMFL